MHRPFQVITRGQPKHPAPANNVINGIPQPRDFRLKRGYAVGRFLGHPPMGVRPQSIHQIIAHFHHPFIGSNAPLTRVRWSGVF